MPDGSPSRSWFARDPVALAPLLLGAVLAREDDDGLVAIRLTEVEAYRGSDDPGSHAFRGRTPRTETMFGEAGHLYCYLSYGMHHALNVVAGVVGEGSGVLLRAGEVVEGAAIARARREARPRRSPIPHLASGPGNLGACLAATRAMDGDDLLGAGWALRPVAPLPHRTGARVGVSGAGGDGDRFPWRFWLPAEPSVSAYRPATVRRGQAT